MEEKIVHILAANTMGRTEDITLRTIALWYTFKAMWLLYVPPGLGAGIA